MCGRRVARYPLGMQSRTSPAGRILSARRLTREGERLGPLRASRAAQPMTAASICNTSQRLGRAAILAERYFGIDWSFELQAPCSFWLATHPLLMSKVCGVRMKCARYFTISVTKLSQDRWNATGAHATGCAELLTPLNFVLLAFQ